MDVNSIRQIIAAAKQQERRSHSLQQYFEQKVAELRRQLLLPTRQPAVALVEFVERYIDHVPMFIDSLMSRSLEFDLQDFVAPFTHMAENFFLAPPAELVDEADLQSLLKQAFLAQRLIEEVSDRYIKLRRTPLLAIDMTQANVIVHHLIGDARANRLDTLVQQSVALLIDHNHLFHPFNSDTVNEASLLAIWQDLPCLSRTTRIELRLGATTHSSS
jgi:hypothetical protein